MNHLNKNKKTILIVSCVFDPEPIVSAKLSKDLADQLSFNENLIVKVIAPQPSRPYGFKFINNKKTHKFKLTYLNSFIYPKSNIIGRIIESWSFGIACKRYIKKYGKNIDLVYMNSWPIFSQYFIAKTIKQLNIPLITHVQDVYPESFSNKLIFFQNIINSILLPFDKFILNNSAVVISISKKMSNYLAETRKLKPNKLHIVNNWQNEQSFIEYQSLNNNNKSNLFTFMYLGNIGPVAGIDLLIDSFEKADIKNSQLIIAGSGSRKVDLEKKVFNRKIERVKFLSVKNGKVPEIQSNADVMLLPIKKGAALSSIPSKLPAYMFSRKPILGSIDLESDTAQALLNSDSGWVIEPENIKALSETMKKVYFFDKKLLEIKGNNGYKYALANFSKTRNLNKIVKIISNLINDNI